MTSTTPRLDGRVALVAGATRGAGRGIAVALGEAGATVFCTGRATREHRSEVGRPKPIEETADLVNAAGGRGIAVAVDHLDVEAVRALVRRIDEEQRRLDVLVNDVWGAEHLFAWDTPLWEHDLDAGLRLLRLAIETHLVTSHVALPLLIRSPGGLVVEMPDGTRDYSARTSRVSAFYDLAKSAVRRLTFALARELAPHGCTALALTPGWLRSEAMLEAFGVTEAGGRRARRRPGRRAPQRRLVLLRGARARVRLLGRRRVAPGCWRSMVEVQDAGRPADPTGYR